MKGVISNLKKNLRTVTMIMIKIYMNLLHVCLVMTKVLVDILMTVRNRQIGFYIQEQRVI